MPKLTLRLRFITIICALVVLLLGVATLGLSNMAVRVTNQNISDKFTWDSQQITSRMTLAADAYAETLITGRSFILNSEEVSFVDWVGFYKSQDIFNHLPGLSSVSYIQVVQEGELDAFIKARRSDSEYGPSYDVIRDGSTDEYALSRLVVTKSPLKLTGFNVYSTADRKKVYDQALQSGQPVASPQIKLNSGFTGMFVVQAMKSQGQTGFINTALHSEDFFNDVLLTNYFERAAVQINDITPSEDKTTLFESPNWGYSSDKLQRSDQISFGGRTWEIVYRDQGIYNDANFVKAAPYLVMGTGLFIITMLFVGLYALTRRIKRNEKIDLTT